MAAPRAPRPLLTVVALLLATASLGFAACGDDDEQNAANGTDRAFAAEMVPHHEMAVQMARAAQDNASRKELRTLADEIIATQNTEIDQLRAAERRMREAGVEPGDLGIGDAMMGMDMDMSMLERREGFDRMFIDTMIPHHQGAIRMARVQLKDGGDPERQALAREVVSAQSREIEQMNAWREQWYGAPSPSGGVPEAGDAPAPAAGEHGMDHGG